MILYNKNMKQNYGWIADNICSSCRQKFKTEKEKESTKYMQVTKIILKKDMKIYFSKRMRDT